MHISDAIINRKSTRAYLDTPVSMEKIERVLELARHAPSGANAQPWQVAVVTGEKKKSLEKALEQAFAKGEEERTDYQYYPQTWKAPYKRRRVECGIQLYSTLGIDRKDRQKRLQQWSANYRAFDAPMVLYFFQDVSLATGSILDNGMFLQTVMLAAVDEGLATCPQAALGQYPDIVRQALGYPEETILLCGMAIGYEKIGAKVNSYRTPREEVQNFTRFFD